MLLKLLILVAVAKIADSTTCTYFRSSPTRYECRLMNQNIDSELDMVEIGGEHLPGMTDEHVTVVRSMNSRMNIFPSLIVDKFVNVRDLFVQRSSIRVFNRPITNCTQLGEVNLDFNDITMLPARIFQNCHEITHLWMRNNSIDTINDNAFVGLVALRTIDLSGNNLKTLNPAAFTPLIRLSTIEIDSNFLESVSPQFFQNLPSLRSFSAIFNQMTTWNTPAAGNQHHALIFLMISGNQIRTLNPGAFGIFPNLQNLQVGDLIEVVPTLTNVPDLRDLWITRNLLTHIQAESFVNMVNLTTLTLSHNQIVSVDFANRNQRFLQNLEILRLGFNQITHLEANAFQMLTSLVALELQWNRIQRLNANAIHPIAQMRRLDVNNNNIRVIERAIFDHVNDLHVSSFGNVCTSTAVLIYNVTDFNERVAPILRSCLSSAVSTNINFLVILTAFAISMFVKM